MVEKVLLGIDFVGDNFPAALYSIQQWWAYANRGGQHACMFGISNFCDRSTPLPRAAGLTPNDGLRIISSFVPKEQLVQWTSDIDAALLGKVEANGGRSQPFYPEFSYGSVVNRLLLLAASHGCDYLVRIDPGTLPPREGTFAEWMKKHQDEIKADPRIAVSRRYAERLALRDMFVQKERRDDHAKLVEQFTGIDVQKQVTGGAMLTLKTPGTPAICFPGGAGPTLVWASDDGAYQVLGNGRLLDDGKEEHRVRRFDPEGKPKKPREYYRGILGAVYLKALRDKVEGEKARERADGFIKALLLEPQILDDEKCKEVDPQWCETFTHDSIAPKEFVEAIRKGYKNHQTLLREWDKMCVVLKPSVVRETTAGNHLDTDEK